MPINHFTATGIVFNSKKQVLMIFHNKLQVWLPPGGHIEENEIPEEIDLKIDSVKMFKDGFAFYLSDNNIWLVDRVPVEYIALLSL